MSHLFYLGLDEACFNAAQMPHCLHSMAHSSKNKMLQYKTQYVTLTSSGHEIQPSSESIRKENLHINVSTSL